MKIDGELIKYVAALAKLEITPEERDDLIRAFEEIIGYFDTVKTAGDFPPPVLKTDANALRTDEASAFSDTQALLDGAPQVIDRMFSVPKAVD